MFAKTGESTSGEDWCRYILETILYWANVRDYFVFVVLEFMLTEINAIVLLHLSYL